MYKKYNPKYMEEDGTCEDFFSSLEYNHKGLVEDLTSPANMYNARVLCLCRGIAKKIKTIIKCIAAFRGMDCNFSRKSLQIQISMGGGT